MTPNLAQQAKRVVTLACANNVWLVTAESCTAGLLATLLADVPGAGETFHGGIVAYSKACKRTVLEVPELFLEKYTAVSREVAEAMATGALKLCGADIAIAITGVAGPEPDEDGNPVGLAYVACATRAGQQRQIRLQLRDTDRSRNRERMMEEGLKLLEGLLDEQ
jgi:PncC family amidohydrolase